AGGKGQGPKTLLRDRALAFETVAVGALVESRQRRVDPPQRVGFQLNQRQLDIPLDIGLRAFLIIGSLAIRGAPRLTDPALDLVPELGAAALEHRPELNGPASGLHRLLA